MVQCISIKSKKNPHLQCPNQATKGEFCVRHWKSKVVWTDNKPKARPFTRRQKAAGETISKFWMRFGRPRLRRLHGPATFALSLSHNDKDIYSFDPISTVPLKYHFSYADQDNRVWTFDLRFLLHMLQYGKELKNAFTQEKIHETVTIRLQALADALRKAKQPIVYADESVLTPDQIWNQKVLDVFLKLNALGYGANLLWFENLTVRGHEIFYRNMYRLWTTTPNLSNTERERLVPGHSAGRTPLFRWIPDVLEGKGHDLKWWRKQNLALMNAFLSRGQDRATQGCCALYVLTAFVQTHPQAREVFPWLAAEDGY